MISEGSCDTEEQSNYAELFHIITVFNLINAALVNIRDLFQNV